MVIAKIDHSGRIPAPDVIAATHWAVGDRTHAHSVPTPSSSGEQPANVRRLQSTHDDNCSSPAGARAQFGLNAMAVLDDALR
ncbi:hypothetical protein [Lentzea terrae]|uniref:hypothetical protein n=1 Tax=Lentzea terrae TaxID=2200761 RepID=UPI0013003D32|nr:hypothetical protein [Lentzea terrae]